MKPPTTLSGRRIGIPESRQLDLFAAMLTQRDAIAVRCPLVAIRDTDDVAHVSRWFDEIDERGLDQMIWLTGEGVRRLSAFAKRNDRQAVFDTIISTPHPITRGPKPGRELKQFDVEHTTQAVRPTTEGVIDTLSRLALIGQRIGVQLYGDEPNRTLIEAIENAGAIALPVAPYKYADAADEATTAAFVERILDARLDAIAFTSAGQVDRLVKVAHRSHPSRDLIGALNQICVAAVGPLVADRLRACSIDVDLMPKDTYFMKPLVRELVRYFSV